MSTPLSMLAGPCSHSEDIKKSRFLAQAAPVQSPDEALAFVRKVSDLAATHNCWAYRIGQDYRFNDDGEPGGTAGRPILQAIEGQGIDFAVVVVTRWYGGIKLGAGGLVRAYGGTAAECLRLAARVPIVETVRMRLQCDFAEQPLMKARLRELGAEVESESFETDGVTMVFAMPKAITALVARRVQDVSRGRVVPRWLDEA